MNIEYFERNDADQIVAVEGSEKLILPFSFVAEFKPTVGDSVFQEGESFYFGPKNVVEDVAAKEVPEATPIEVPVEPLVIPEA